MTGQTDLGAMLASIEVSRRPGIYAFVTVNPDPNATELVAHELTANELSGHALATVSEPEGVTYVVAVDIAERLGFKVPFRAAWLTLDVHSALDAVGLTAAVSARLASAGIACNMLAGYFHDHLLVPVDAADQAIAAIESLGDDHRSDRQRTS